MAQSSRARDAISNALRRRVREAASREPASRLNGLDTSELRSSAHGSAPASVSFSGLDLLALQLRVPLLYLYGD